MVLMLQALKLLAKCGILFNRLLFTIFLKRRSLFPILNNYKSVPIYEGFYISLCFWCNEVFNIYNDFVYNNKRVYTMILYIIIKEYLFMRVFDVMMVIPSKKKRIFKFVFCVKQYRFGKGIGNLMNLIYLYCLLHGI